jgi:hypothetical protein
MPSRSIFALMLRSAEQETPMPTGQRRRGAAADHAHVEREVLAAELRADAGLRASFERLRLELAVAEGAAELVAAVVGRWSR